MNSAENKNKSVRYFVEDIKSTNDGINSIIKKTVSIKNENGLIFSFTYKSSSKKNMIIPEIRRIIEMSTGIFK